ncbi:hypothetical protein FRB99_001822 [Tulasnella sp. 403]|nr:hypothetical protein FRB99_001822 [Tulasnella sp. 403]
MDTSTIQNLLEKLRSSTAFASIAGVAPPNFSDPEATSSSTPHPEPHPQTPQPSSIDSNVSSRISSLLSRLRDPGPAEPTLAPSVAAETTIVDYTYPEEIEPEVQIPKVRVPSPPKKPDPRSMSYVESLSTVEALLKDPTCSGVLLGLQAEQRQLEQRLWESREAITSRYTSRLKTTQDKTTENDETQNDMERELRRFDVETALPAWDALVKKQQQTMENLGVPMMFPTTDLTSRTRQQRLVRVIEEGLVDEM